MFKDFVKSNFDGASLGNGLFRMPASQAKYVEFGYGQVEPNHLSAQRNGQIYAQLPADPEINILEQGQFVKYDYAANDNGIGEVNFDGAGEWMLVYNEIKLYRDHYDGTKQWDCEFAMIKDDYQARIYSPYDYEHPEVEYSQRYLNGKDAAGNTSITVNTTVTLDAGNKTVTIDGERYNVANNKFTYNGTEYTLVNGAVTVPVVYGYDDVTKDVANPYDYGFTNDPYKALGLYQEKKMPAGTVMVPRVFKTAIGDIFTTNTIDETTLAIGDILSPRDTDGILVKVADATGPVEDPAGTSTMQWQVVKIYTMPDGQNGVKVMRIA